MRRSTLAAAQPNGRNPLSCCWSYQLKRISVASILPWRPVAMQARERQPYVYSVNWRSKAYKRQQSLTIVLSKHVETCMYFEWQHCIFIKLYSSGVCMWLLDQRLTVAPHNCSFLGSLVRLSSLGECVQTPRKGSFASTSLASSE